MTDPQPTLTLELLLAHGGFVRAVALGLVLDEHAADDVVQETFLRALERGPRKPARLAGWLRVVAQNVVFASRRAAASRARREAAQGSEPRVPWPEEILEREELRRRVVQAVYALDEPYRSAVLLRYFEELQPDEIARFLDVPVTTVRTRLHRAREMLRGRLRSAYGSDRSWMAGLVVLSGVDRQALLATAGPTLAGGALAACAGLLLLATAAVLVISAPPSPSRSEQPAPALRDLSASRGEEAAAGSSLDGDSVRLAVAADSEDPLTRVPAIRFRVLDPSGQPLEAVELRARRTRNDDSLPFAKVEYSRAGDQLVFQPAGSEPLDFEFRAEGFVGAQRPAVLPGESLDVFLHPGVTVKGCVIDASTGAPIPGASIVAETERDVAGRLSWQTDVAGAFEIVLAPICFSLHVSGSGFIEWTASPFRPNPDETLLVRLVPESAGGDPCFVRVLEAETRRLADDVRFEPGPAEPLGSGLFRVGCRQAFEARRGFAVEAPGRVGFMVWLSADQGTDPAASIEIRLPRTNSLIGTVLDPEGRPIEGVAVRLTTHVVHDADRRATMPFSLDTLTDASGHFRLDGLAPPDYSSYALSLSHPDFAGFSRRAITILDTREFEMAPIRLSRGCSVRGRVVRASDRAPVPGARATLYRFWPESSPVARSDDAGRFALAGVSGQANLIVRAEGLVPWESGRREWTADTELCIELAGGESIGGLVVDDGGRPVAGAVVRAKMQPGSRDPRVRVAGEVHRNESTFACSGADGRFVVEGLLPGPYLLTAARTGPPRGDAWQSFVTAAMTGSQDARVVVEAVSGVALRTVAARDGQSILLFRCYFAAGCGPGAHWQGRGSTEANSNGTRFVPLPPATPANILVEADGYAPCLLTGVCVGRGEVREVVAELGEPATLSGLVLDESGRPVPDVAIVLSLASLGTPDDSDVSEQHAVSDAAGRYTFPRLCEGTWVIRSVSVGRYRETFTRPGTVSPTTFALGSAERRQADLVLATPLGGTIRGRVVLPADDRKIEVVVCAQRSGSAGGEPGSFSTPVDGLGRFELPQLPAGEHFVSARIRVSPDRADGFSLHNAAGRKVMVPENGVVEVELVVADLR